jgi:penicillin-binding protein 2
MNQNIAIRRLLTRRAFVFGAANLAALGVIAGRLYNLQFMHAEQYRTLAEGNRIKITLITPVRGLLLDRHGVVMANNQKNFRLYLDTEARNNPQEVLAALTKVLPISADRISDIVDQMQASRHPPPVLIKEHLTWDELAQFEFYHLNYPEVFVDTGQIRYYPFGERAAHLLGYVASPDKSKPELQKLSRLPDFKIGQSGVEQMLEERLEGTPGTKQTEVNVHGLAVRELGRKEGKPGENITLTIDSRLQEYASARLGSESAAAVVMNIHNGDVLALTSMPGFDPNSFSKGILQKYWDQLRTNPRNPLMNKAISGQYPPGSTFKLSMGLAALENKVATIDTEVFCNGHFQYGNHVFTCWRPNGHGMMTLHTAIMQSCDVFFYTMAQRLGIDNIAGMARKMGLGKPTGIGLPEEKGGIVPDDAWKRAKYGEGWQGGDTINVGIGQGYVIATPLQMAVMTARIANGQFAVKPRLVADAEPQFDPLGVNEDNISAVQDGMNAVCNTPGGTAYAHRITDERFTMAGKTGTSQVRKLIRHGMDQNKLPWEDRHHAWFVGYAPVAAPKYAAAVIVEHGGGGATAAAPVVRDLLLKIQAMDAGEPGPPLPDAPKTDGDNEVD